MDTFFLFLPLYITYLFLTDFKTPVNIWGSLTLSLAGLGGIYPMVNQFRTRFLEKLVNLNLIPGFMYFSIIIFVKTPLCFFPAAFLLFAIYFFHWNAGQARPLKPWLPPVIFFPAVVTFFIPLDPKDYLSLRCFLLIINLWAIPYITIVYILLFKLFIFDLKFKNDRFFSLITIIAMSATYISAVYLLPLFHFPLFKLNLYLLIIFFGLFFLLVAKYGFLGIKLSVRNIYLNHNLKAVDSGMSALNYQIKEHLSQIIACAREIDTAAEDEEELILEKAQSIFAATTQILQVTQQLHYYFDKITPQPRQVNLAELVRRAIGFFKLQIEEKAFRIINNLPSDLIIESDPIYLTEVLKHILKNALEAMEPGGRIEIDATLSKKVITLLISDTGCGISPSERPHIMKPFYTTKSRGRHFGLGLSYCYNVMQHLGGRLEINSIDRKGTTIVLKLPVSDKKQSLSSPPPQLKLEQAKE